MADHDIELPSRRGLVFDMVVYGLGEVLARALNLLLLPLLTAYLQPAEYGVVALLTSLGFFLVPVFSLGIGGAIAPVYFEGNSPSRKQQTIVAALAILTVAITALIGVAYVSGGAVSEWLLKSREHVALVHLTVAGSCFAILTIPFRQRLQFEQRSTTYATLSVLTLVVITVATAVQVVLMKRGALGMIEASCLGQFVGLVVFAAAAAPGLKASYHGAVARSVLALSLPLVPAFGAVFLLQHGAKYVIQWQRGLDEVGIYTAGANIGMAVSVAVTAFQGAWLPYFMRFERQRETASEHFGQLLTYFVLAFGGLALLLFAVARPIVMLITQPPYHEAWRVIGLVATGQVLSGVFVVLLPGVYYAREVATVGVTQSLAAASGLVLAALLVPGFGAFGGALAFAGSYAVLVLSQQVWNKYRNYTPIHIQRSRLARFGLVYAVFAAITFWQPAAGLAGAWIWGLALATAVPVVLYAQLRTSEREQVRAAVRSLPRFRNHVWGSI